MTRRVLGLVLLAVLVLAAWAETEAQMRQRLGIPQNAKRVLILSQSSHMDWDWNETFPGYYKDSVDRILSNATTVLAKHRAQTHPYYYSVAETGFLQRFGTYHPNALASLRSSGHLLHMVGGGITSPDSLLNHGEAFIRNFLVGQNWLRSAGMPNISNIWVPDDFGHDGQLPVMVRAMGLGAAGFARVPGAHDQGPAAKRVDGQPSTADVLMKEGVSFTWQANDGSSMFAHWLQAHYNQGDNIDQSTMGNSNNCSSYSTSFNTAITNYHIGEYIASNWPTAVSPYMFVAIGDDFQAPKPCLLTYISNWNKMVFGSALPNNDVYVVSATFDHYVSLVSSYTSNTTNQRPLQVRQFEPTPYWTGFYASRPALKILQEAAVREAMAGEALTFITKTTRRYSPILQDAWARIAPSTHHDFVTGTAPDTTYRQEQLPYLQAALNLSGLVTSFTMHALASTLYSKANVTETEAGLVYFNPLGSSIHFATIKVPNSMAPNAVSFFDGKMHRPIQREGGYIITRGAEMNSYTYTVGHFSNSNTNYTKPYLKLKVVGNENYVLENEFIQVTISEAAGWGVTSIKDKFAGTELLQLTSKDPAAFNLQILSDPGNIYRFANEMPNCNMGTTSPQFTPQTLNFSAVYAGAIRIVFPTTVVTTVNGVQYSYTRKYILYENDPMLRVEVSGAAPKGTSVFMRTPLSILQPTVSYGTPYHWDTHMPPVYWPGYNFFAAHNYVTLSSPEGVNVAFYSAHLRAWALDGATVVTALFRNTPGGQCNGYGADGTDSDAHTVSFAFRAPVGLSPAPSFVPLQESLAFSTPVLTAPVTQYAQTSSPSMTLISSINAVITSIKPAEADPSKLVVRIYCPTASPTSPQQVTIYGDFSFGNDPRSVKAITALENPLKISDNAIRVLSVGSSSAMIGMKAALGTLILSPQ